MKLISSKEVKARKEDHCDYCDQIITVGTIYKKSTFKDKKCIDWKSHLECEKLATKLKLFKDGFCEQGSFYAGVLAAYNKIGKENINFREKLQIVLKKYLPLQ